jgi:hypothetical protein
MTTHFLPEVTPCLCRSSSAVPHLQAKLANLSCLFRILSQNRMAQAVVLGMGVTQAQPSTFNKKIQLIRSLSLFYFVVSIILYSFEQLVSLFDPARPNSPAQLGIRAQHPLRPSAQPDPTCVLPRPLAQPLHPINRQPHVSPSCIAGPRPPPRTPVPRSPCVAPCCCCSRASPSSCCCAAPVQCCHQEVERQVSPLPCCS